MPELSRFYGIIIFMNYRDHNPPHFHARYQDFEITVDIKTGKVTGTMTRKALKLVFEWMDLYKEELMHNWDLARDRKALIPIEPLI